jgi:riboflavin kinase/FMN adenylyltransferase
MKVHFGFDAWKSSDRTIVTIGNFDGVHLGHQAIIRRVVDLAAERSVQSVAITFDPVPKKVLHPQTAPPLIETLEQRLEHLAELGLDDTIVVKFDQKFASHSPEDFVERYLVAILRVQGVVVGQNFSFGHEKRGTLALLKQLGEVQDFVAEGIPEVKVNGQRVSSTFIREKVKAGEMEEARIFMGRPFALKGTIVPGEKLGGTIGIPTANLKPENEILPATGVYATRTLLATGQDIPSVTNVGYRPTVGGKTLTVEAHLLRYSGNLYDQKIQLQFYRKLREEMRFNNLQELKDKIHSDIQEAEAYFS